MPLGSGNMECIRSANLALYARLTGLIITGRGFRQILGIAGIIGYRHTGALYPVNLVQLRVQRLCGIQHYGVWTGLIGYHTINNKLLARTRRFYSERIHASIQQQPNNKNQSRDLHDL